MLTDCRGCPVSATDRAEVEEHDAALELFLNYENSAGGVVKQVLVDHPSSVMTLVLRGAMLMMLEASALHPKVSALVTATADSADHANERERGHLRALGQWAAGDIRAATREWDLLLAAEPTDLLALKLHHYTTFWTGRAGALLGTVDGVIDAWDQTTPGVDHVLGMRSFALNENGRYEAAEAIGREAVAANPEDLWSIHAVAHALEMQGAGPRGDAFFDELVAERPDRWATKNPFLGHIWWHAALFPWDAGRYDRVLQLYDERLRPASTDFYLDIQNLSSLLTRLELAGVDVGDRWDELGEHAAARVGDHVLDFTDVHCALTLARTGRLDDLDRFVASLADRLAGLPEGLGQQGPAMALAVADALAAAGRGDHAGAADRLAAIRHDLAPIGGSHAQRDLFDLLLADEMLQAERFEVALGLLRARARRWPDSVPTQHKLGQAVAGATAAA